MKSKAAAFIRRHGMIPPRGEGALRRVRRGGQHSHAAPAARARIRRRVRHFNHMIRGAESDRDEEFVRARCAALGVPSRPGGAMCPHLPASAAWAPRRPPASCATAFSRRRRSPARARASRRRTTPPTTPRPSYSISSAAPGLRGMCGIAPVRGNIIRPMLCLDRPEIEGWLRGERHTFRHRLDQPHGGLRPQPHPRPRDRPR